MICMQWLSPSMEGSPRPRFPGHHDRKVCKVDLTLNTLPGEACDAFQTMQWKSWPLQGWGPLSPCVCCPGCKANKVKHGKARCERGLYTGNVKQGTIGSIGNQEPSGAQVQFGSGILTESTLSDDILYWPLCTLALHHSTLHLYIYNIQPSQVPPPRVWVPPPPWGLVVVSSSQ